MRLNQCYGNESFTESSSDIRRTVKYNRQFFVAFVFFISIYLHTRYTESEPSHLGIALIMKDKRSKIKTNEQMIQKMMMLLSIVFSLHIHTY